MGAPPLHPPPPSSLDTQQQQQQQQQPVVEEGMFWLEASKSGPCISFKFTLTQAMSPMEVARDLLSTVQRERERIGGGAWEWESFVGTLAPLLEAIRSCKGLCVTADLPDLDLKLCLRCSTL